VLNMASLGGAATIASRRSASISQRRFQWHPETHLLYDVFCRRRDAWRRSSKVVSNGIRSFNWAKYGILCWRREEWRRGSRRRFSYVMYVGVP
jgi:hypothetical protein